MTYGLGILEMHASHLGRFICDTWAAQGVNGCKKNWGGFGVTSGLGKVDMKASNWKRFLCDIWVGQRGNGFK